MKLTIEMHEPDQKILEELAFGVSQKSIASTYAFCIAQLGDKADWPKINAAIRERWKRSNDGLPALARIRRMAWKQVREWEKRGQEERRMEAKGKA